MPVKDDGTPFDALGRILSEGGDIQLANAISRGNDRQELLLLARWADWGVSDSDLATVRGIAEQAVRAGQELTAMDPNDPINFSIVPVNPLLFGGENQGLRFYTSTDFQLSSTGKWYRADFLFPDLYSTDAIHSEIAARAELMTDNYPRMFGGQDGSQVTITAVAIQVIIGSF